MNILSFYLTNDISMLNTYKFKIYNVQLKEKDIIELKLFSSTTGEFTLIEGKVVQVLSEDSYLISFKDLIDTPIDIPIMVTKVDKVKPHLTLVK